MLTEVDEIFLSFLLTESAADTDGVAEELVNEPLLSSFFDGEAFQ